MRWGQGVVRGDVRCCEISGRNGTTPTRAPAATEAPASQLAAYMYSKLLIGHGSTGVYSLILV